MERDSAWKLAARTIARAHAGRGAVLLYEGEFGIGKSGLMAAVRALAVESRAQVLTAAGHRGEREFPFGVAVQLLEAVPDGADSDAASRLATELTGSDPDFGRLHDLYRFFRQLAAALPVLVLIDDVDLADEPSLKLLQYVMARMPDLPLALILAAGAVPSRRAPPQLAEIARHRLTTRCRLEPLSESGTARRMSKTWLPGAFDHAAAEIHRASNGNPLLTDALAAALAAPTGDAPRPSVDQLAPRGVAEWARARAAELDGRAPALLEAIAVFGQGCELRHAAALANQDTTTAAALADALRDAALLANGDRLWFRQPVVGTAILASLPSGASGVGHLQAARLLAAEGAPPERPAEFLLGATRTGSGWVVDALRQAAGAALQRAAPWDAVRYLRRALEEPPPRGERVQVMLDLGKAEAMAGEPQAAMRLRQAAEHLTQAPEQPRAALTTGRTLLARGRPTQALTVFERGLASAVDADPTIVGQLRSSEAAAGWLTNFANGGRRVAVRLPARAETPGDRGLLALHAIEAAIRGTPCGVVRALANEALGEGALLADETADGPPFYMATAALALAGDLDGAEAALTAAVGDARSRGSLLGIGTASQMLATVLLMRGNLLHAAAEARRALAVEPYGWRIGATGARVVLASTLAARGNLDGARRELDAADEATGEIDAFRLSFLDTRGQLRMASGETDAALTDFLDCGALADRAAATNSAVVPWRSHAGLALAALGDSREARRLTEEELRIAEAFGAPGPIGRALRTLASVGGPADARETLEAAVDTLKESQEQLEYAGALVDLGAALRRSGQRLAARRPLRGGLALAKQCGATELAARVVREMRLAGARPRRAALHGTESLTAREQEVASLAADGLSNRRIAERLVVTLKTVEWHLSHCYVKLGVRSRHELRDRLEPPG